MTMHEFLAEAQARQNLQADPNDPNNYAGGLNEGQLEEISKFALEE